MESDEDDAHNEDHSHSQPYPSLGHAESSYRDMEENLHISRLEFIELETLLAQVDLPMLSMHQQTGIEETHIYQSLASDCYRPSLDQLELNRNMITMTTTTLPMQMSQSPTPDYTDQHILGFDLLGWTPSSAFTMDYIF